MTTEQELNEKLLKFAGIEHGEYPSCIFPAGYSDTCPVFTRDIDACIEILGELFTCYEINKVAQVGRADFQVLIRIPTGWVYSEWEDNPALAFCRATEKAIELHSEEAKK